MTTKSFESWEYEEVENTFELVRVENHPILMEWLAANENINDLEQVQLQSLQRLLHIHAEDWNKQELQTNFIAPLLWLVNFEHSHYRTFAERALTANLGEIKVNGVVDFMLASGKQRPKQPYFCLHEYKRLRGRKNDPVGQLLIAMLCAQAKNNKAEQPIYGLIVEGRFWYFVTLTGKEYAMSEPLTATRDDDLRLIFKMLRYLKVLIEHWL